MDSIALRYQCRRGPGSEGSKDPGIESRRDRPNDDCNQIRYRAGSCMNWGRALKRILWQGPAWLYELAVRLRIAAYETGYLKPERLQAAVVSVGNITLGGTGKTPLVDYIARYLSEEGYRVSILSRGYGRGSRGQIVLNEAAVDDGASQREIGRASCRER